MSDEKCMEQGINIGIATTRAWMDAYHEDWAEARRYVKTVGIKVERALEAGCLVPSPESRNTLNTIIKEYESAIERRDTNATIEASKNFEGIMSRILTGYDTALVRR